MSFIYINKASLQSLLDKIVKREITPTKVIFVKKYVQVKQILVSYQLFPTVIENIVCEYMDDVITLYCTIGYTHIHSATSYVMYINICSINNFLNFRKCDFRIVLGINVVTFKAKYTLQFSHTCMCHRYYFIHESNQIMTQNRIHSYMIGVFNCYARLYGKGTKDMTRVQYMYDNNCIHISDGGSKVNIHNHKLFRNMSVITMLLMKKINSHIMKTLPKKN